MKKVSLKIKPKETGKNKIKLRKLMKEGIIPKNVGVSLFIGSVGSGKSTLVINLLSNPCMYGKSKELLTKKDKDEEKCYFDAIFVLTGSDDDLYDNLIKMKVIEKEKIKVDPEPDDIQKLIDLQRKSVAKKGIEKAEKVLIILDDVVDNGRLMRSQALKTLFIKPRQLNFCVFFLAQYLNLIPRALRMQARNIFFFRSTRVDHEILCDQFCPSSLNKRDFIKLIDQATEDRNDETHNFLHINRTQPLNKRFRRNLDKIIKIGF